VSALATTALDRLAAEGVLAVIRAPDAEGAVHAGRALVRGGVRALEVAFTTPDAAEAIAELARDPAVLVGAGTVLTAEQARAAIEAGARFLVSPGLVEPVLELGGEAGVLAIPGALTPTEVLAAARRAPVVKLFPASLGGPAYLRALLAPLPQLRVIPTGGVSAANIADWCAAGAFALGVGGDLCAPAAIAARDDAAIAAAAGRCRDALDRAREQRA
jgi:2-dehydro-3-deoxyphosphogluconate aldolase/(4S)-4-hydroxy-2-oxoglutarate aldolase